MRYTRSPCVIEQKVGGKYSIIEGRISGTFIAIVMSLSLDASLLKNARFLLM